MRITIVTGFFLPVPPVRGGSTEKIWHRLAQEFSAAGHTVTFISRRWPGLKDSEVSDGVRHLRLPGVDHSSSLALNLLHDLRWGTRVSRALPPADVTICNTVTLPAWLGRVRKDVGRVVAVVARMPKGHGRFYGRVDLLLSLSGAVTAALVRENPRLRGRIAAFPYPIDWALHAAASAERRRGQARSPLRIGYIGRVHPEKGIGLLLRAAARLVARNHVPDWRLQVLGPAAVALGGGGETYQQSLVAGAAPDLLGRVEFLGPEFDAWRLARRYAELDVFCYPSLAEAGETFGVAVAEAMAAHCVPVVSQLECFRELITPGETGLRFNHGAADADEQLAAQLARVLADEPWRRTLAGNAQAFARRFDYADVARRLLRDLGANAGAPSPNL